MRDMPLTVITWRIGKSSIDTIESLLVKESRCDDILRSLQKEFESIFYLATCQRIVLVSSIDNKRHAIDLRNRFIELSGQSINRVECGEVFVGSQALKHLAELVASLDSTVIGEEQIQHQFKQAYQRNEKFLDQNLKQILQQVIRIGKRIRHRTILGEGKISMMSLIVQIYKDQLKEADSIGILGTGKMAQGVISVASELNQSITIYTRKPERIGIELNGYKTEKFSNLHQHDIVFTATTVDMPLITKEKIGQLVTSPITIFDLGMPRNCSLEIDELIQVKLVGIEDLLKLSHHVNSQTDFTNVYQVLEDEINSVLNIIINKQKAPYYISLRTELSRDRKSTRLNSSHTDISRMPSSA